MTLSRDSTACPTILQESNVAISRKNMDVKRAIATRIEADLREIRKRRRGTESGWGCHGELREATPGELLVQGLCRQR